MVNPRFLAKADEWKNPSLPVEKTKPSETKPSSSGLTQILERDKDGKPILNLTPFEKTAVNPPTQESYDELMRTYELGGWVWGTTRRSLPTQNNLWGKHKEETCIDAGVDYPSGVYNEGRFMYADREFYLKEGWRIISTQQFYETQKITPEMLNEVNVWFDRNDK